MVKVELVYDSDCPNVKATREQLRLAFELIDSKPDWQEWNVNDPNAPDHIHGYGSPTILVEGIDVTGDEPSGTDNCCRVYVDSDHANHGVPSVKQISSALLGSAASGFKHIKIVNGLSLNLTVLPSVGAAFLPQLSCPLCWPAYTGLLSTFGLGFVNYTPYLFPLMAIFLLIAVGALAYRAKSRRGYKPFLLGTGASILILIGKFILNSDPAMYFGIALIIAASLWNTWPKRKDAVQSCPL